MIRLTDIKITKEPCGERDDLTKYQAGLRLVTEVYVDPVQLHRFNAEIEHAIRQKLVDHIYHKLYGELPWLVTRMVEIAETTQDPIKAQEARSIYKTIMRLISSKEYVQQQQTMERNAE